MSLAYRTSAVGGNTVSGTSPTAVIAPAVNDLFVVFCQATDNTNTAPTCSDGNTGGTYTLVTTAQSNANGNTLSCFVRNNLLANTTSTTVTVACGAHTAVEISVVAVSGENVAGTAAIVQNAIQANRAGGTTPSPTFGATTNYTNMLVAAVGNATNPGGVTQPTGWTRPQNVGQTACGLTINYDNSQNLVTNVPFGSTSASVYSSIMLELTIPPNTGVDASKLVAYTLPGLSTGVDASKLTAYFLPGISAGVDVSKLVAYAVLAGVNTNPPVWPAVSPPVGYILNPYSLSWDLTPASAPTTYTLVSGSLPPGLALNSVGGASDVGSITGTPTTLGTYPFTVRATNAYGTANQPLTITILAPAGAGGAFVFMG